MRSSHWVPIIIGGGTTHLSLAVPTPGTRLNKFVRRLHDMLQAEQKSGLVEWRRGGLLVLHSTAAFATQLLPKYFNTRNFKTFRRQLNYYGFVHVRSFSTTGSSTTALWVNQALARMSDDVRHVLTLKRVEPVDKESRRSRKEMAMTTVEDDLKALPMDHIKNLALRGDVPSDLSVESEDDAANVLLLLSKGSATA